MSDINSSSLLKIIGSRIRARREKLGFSQSDCASKAGMHQPNLSLIENGEMSPDISTLERLAGALDCRVADFLKE